MRQLATHEGIQLRARLEHLPLGLVVCFLPAKGDADDSVLVGAEFRFPADPPERLLDNRGFTMQGDPDGEISWRHIPRPITFKHPPISWRKIARPPDPLPAAWTEPLFEHMTFAHALNVARREVSQIGNRCLLGFQNDMFDESQAVSSYCCVTPPEDDGIGFTEPIGIGEDAGRALVESVALLALADLHGTQRKEP